MYMACTVCILYICDYVSLWEEKVQRLKIAVLPVTGTCWTSNSCRICELIPFVVENVLRWYILWLDFYWWTLPCSVTDGHSMAVVDASLLCYWRAFDGCGGRFLALLLTGIRWLWHFLADSFVAWIDNWTSRWLVRFEKGVGCAWTF